MQHLGHKGDLGVIPWTCGAIDERAQVILVWVKATEVGNAFHQQRLGVMRVRPSGMNNVLCPNFRKLKNTLIGGVS